MKLFVALSLPLFSLALNITSRVRCTIPTIFSVLRRCFLISADATRYSRTSFLFLKALFIKILFINLVFISNTAIAQAENITPFSANYKANIKGFAVEAQRELKALTNQQYELRFTAKAFIATIDESVVFTVNNQTISPLHYDYKQSTVGKKRERSLAFNTNNSITSIDNGNSSEITNAQHALDKLSYQLQLQYDVANKQQDLQYTIADKGRLKQYRFEIQNEETITTDIGEITAVKVKVIRENKDKLTYIWFAKEWQHLLVQLEQYNGSKKELSIILSDATVNAVPVTGQ